MGNPTLRTPHPTQAAERLPTVHNGMLAYVDPEALTSGARSLPPAGPDQQAQPTRHVVLDVPGLGLMRITYELRGYKRHRSTNWSWHATWADRVEDGA